jgi:hypothetical protein
VRNASGGFLIFREGAEKFMKHPFLKKHGRVLLKYSALIFSLGFIYGALPANAQTNDKRVEEIRSIYQETNEQIAAAEKNFPESTIFLTELAVNKGGTMYPAVGTFRNTIKFYYTYGDREKNPYPDRLLKITVSTDRAAHREWSEYLFDQSGQLIFYYEKMGAGAEDESRFYFASDKIIRIMRGQRVADINSRQELAAPKAVQAEADKLVAIFRRSL